MAAPDKKTYRIALTTQGTRGDMQPLLGLASGLRAAGHHVRVFGSLSHCEDAKQFGFEAVDCCTDLRDFLASESGMLAANTGDLVAAIAGWVGMEDDEPDWAERMREGFADFPADVVMATPLLMGQTEAVRSECVPGAPLVPIQFQPNFPTDDYGPLSLYRMPLEPGQPQISKWEFMVQHFITKMFQAREEAKAAGASPEELVKMRGPEWVFGEYFRREEVPVPALLAWSESFWPAPDDWPTAGHLITGRWPLNKQDQEENVSKGGGFFNAGGMQEKCADFIAAGDPPVYIGWGSMTVNSKEHMAQLAVDALRISGKRGIIIAGWAEVSSESLSSAPNAAELEAYCEGNVFFMKSASHDWLFPQCACCVHHGGIGTTMASLGAGTPTIVTPVFADQHDIAHHVGRSGWGEGTTRLPKLSSAELGASIKRVCANKGITEKCATLKENMGREDGVQKAVKWVEDFMVEKESGKLAERYEKHEAALAERAKKNMKFRLEQLIAAFSREIAKKFPSLQKWHGVQMETFTILMTAASAGKLFYVKGSSCLARAGEKLKTEEVGKYKQYAQLELLDRKGSRLHVRLLKGKGPDAGWISTEVKGVQIVAEVAPTEVAKLQEEAAKSLFKDIIPVL